MSIVGKTSIWLTVFSVTYDLLVAKFNSDGLSMDTITFIYVDLKRRKRNEINNTGVCLIYIYIYIYIYTIIYTIYIRYIYIYCIYIICTNIC